MQKAITVEVLKPIGSHKAGERVRVVCDDQGVPINREWRRRLRDAEFDQCVRILPEPKPAKKAEQGDDR